jgi:hypothetical protein
MWISETNDIGDSVYAGPLFPGSSARNCKINDAVESLLSLANTPNPRLPAS